MAYSTYTSTGPFSSGVAPGIDAGFLNALETFCHAGWFDSLITSDHAGGLTAVKYSTGTGQLRNIFFLGSFFQLTTNPTVTSGSTSALTGSGGGTGVPSGATAILISGSITSATVGAYVTVASHGAGMTGVPQIGTIQVTNQFASFGNVIVPLASNQIDVKANGGNVILQSWYINGYLI